MEKFVSAGRLLRLPGRKSPLEVGGIGLFVVSYWEEKGEKGEGQEEVSMCWE